MRVAGLSWIPEKDEATHGKGRKGAGVGGMTKGDRGGGERGAGAGEGGRRGIRKEQRERAESDRMTGYGGTGEG